MRDGMALNAPLTRVLSEGLNARAGTGDEEMAKEMR